MNSKNCILFTLLSYELLYPLYVVAEVLVDDFIGREYVSLRMAMVSGGWVLDSSSSKNSVYAEFPEIECGSGVDSICSSGFRKNNDYVAVVVSMKDKKLVVIGNY